MAFRLFAIAGMFCWGAGLWMTRYEGLENAKTLIYFFAIILIVMSFVGYARC